MQLARKNVFKPFRKRVYLLSVIYSQWYAFIKKSIYIYSYDDPQLAFFFYVHYYFQPG